MINQTLQLAESLRADFAAVDQPIDLDRLAKRLGLEVSLCPGLAAAGIEADVRPEADADRFRVRLDPTPPEGWGAIAGPTRARVAEQRRRFRLGHELYHCLNFERRPARGPRRRRPWSLEEEELADRFANALLLPPAAAGAAEPKPEAIVELRQRFAVSLEVAARALAAAHPASGVALWYWQPDWKPEPKALIRQWASPSVSLAGWRQSQLVVEALARGQARGTVSAAADCLAPGAAVVEARALALSQRRQLLLVTAPIST